MNDFRSYLELSKNTYQEHFGLDFEQFAIGQVFHHRPGLTISQQDNADEALDTINNAQLHYDAHYASKTEWKCCLGVSTLTLQRVLGMASKTFARKESIIHFEDIAMTRPVFGADTLYARSTITGKEDHNDLLGTLSVKTEGVNQKGEVVASIAYTMRIYKSGRHPFEEKRGYKRKTLPEKFASHRTLRDGSFMEEIGLYFEDLEPNESYVHLPGKTFSREECQKHALRSIELSPQYANTHYAKEFHEGKLLVQESFVLSVLTALSTRTFDRVVANLGWKNIKMHSKMWEGETLYARSKILDKRESKSRPTQGIMHVETEGKNQDGQLICTYERFFLIYKKGCGPYESAGY